MRIAVFILLVSVLCMCRSKAIVSEDVIDPFSYIVILQGDTSPKSLLKGLDLLALETKQTNKDLNQWTLIFDGAVNDAKSIKTKLLNDPTVTGVFTLEEYEKMIRKNNPGKSDSNSKGRLMKG